MIKSLQLSTNLLTTLSIRGLKATTFLVIQGPNELFSLVDPRRTIISSINKNKH